MAGEGTRMGPLTYTRPKQLLKVANKTILEHNLEQLKNSGITDVVLVVGYMKEKIEDFLRKIGGFNFIFVSQSEQLGTGHALLQAKDAIKEERFLVMYGDDIYGRNDIIKALSNDVCVTGKYVDDPERFGVFITDGNKLKDLIEKPERPGSNIANTGLYVLDKRIFKFLDGIKKSERNEFELTDAVLAMSKEFDIKCEIIDDWIPVGYPWDILTANEKMMIDVKSSSDGCEMEKNITMHGNVQIGRNTSIKNGAYIEGPVIIGENCVIGPNCYIRPNSVIGDNCRIGNGVEIKNSIVGDNTNIEHLSYIGDSIIGNNCNIGAGTVTANLRHDNKTVRVNVKGKIVDTKRRKIGVIMGDYVKTGIHTSIYPGAFIGPFSWTTPGFIIKDKIPPLTLDGVVNLDDNKFNPDVLNEIKFVRESSERRV